MGPSELIVSAVIALGALVPAVTYFESNARQNVQEIQQRYTVDRKCKGPKGLGPCVRDIETGQTLGITQP